MLRTLPLALLAAATLAAPASAALAPKPPLGHAGRWTTDAKGRVFVTHGLNMVYKVPPYYPAHAGFGKDDARFLARNGFNTVRLGVIYKAVEPEPGKYDDGYLAKIAATQRVLAKNGVYSLVDFHQDMYNERFQGEGWPDWAVMDDGMPAEPKNGFPGNYLTMPALNRAFDHFWANDAGPGGIGLRDRYAHAWNHVAARFKSVPGLLGYDLLNEPWPGSEWPSCANTEGCPTFDSGPLTEFVKETLGQVRAADKRTMVFYEPLSVFNFGADTSIADPKDPHAGLSYHVYCLPGAFGGSSAGGCEELEDRPMTLADERSKQTKDALLITEFGATDDFETLQRIERLADEHMVGWQEWHYCACDEPTSQAAPDVQAVVVDPKKPPRGSNLKREKLAVLARPYPQLVAGTPTEWKFDPAKKEFELSYKTMRASGKGRFRRGVTDVFVPKQHYPKGYKVKAKGARVTSKKNARHLLLRARKGAKDVTVKVIRRG